jgi:hypothetical protein
MNSESLSFAEFGILLVASFPWLAGIAVAIVGLAKRREG